MPLLLERDEHLENGATAATSQLPDVVRSMAQKERSEQAVWFV